MRVLQWERYVPDVGDNRERHRRGDPAVVVELREPTAWVWRQFLGGVVESPAYRDLVAEHGSADGTERAIRAATFDDTLVGILWRGCVGAVELPDGYIDGLDTPIKDGAALWAARNTLPREGAHLYADILTAIFSRSELHTGTVVPLASARGSRDSREPGASPDGIAASVARRD